MRTIRVIFLALCLAPALAQAQAWPTRPVSFVVPYPPGGGSDVVARILAEDLGNRLSQTFLVENKPGAATMVGTAGVATAAPDGQTIGLITDSHAINPGYGRPMRYDSERDFAFVTGLIRVPLVLIVNPKNTPYESVPELIAAAKKNPGALTFASLGPGSPHQLAFEWFRALAGIDVRIVPYRGVAPALQGVVSGDINMMLVGVAVADDFIAAGQVKPIAVTSGKRLPRSPDLPTIAEAGFPSYDIVTWYGVVAPAKTPAPVVAKMHDTFQESLQSATVKTRIGTIGAEIFTGSAADFASFVKGETKKYREIIELTGSKIE